MYPLASLSLGGGGGGVSFYSDSGQWNDQGSVADGWVHIKFGGAMVEFFPSN